MPDTRHAPSLPPARALLPRLQLLANVVGAALLVWLTAPLLDIGGSHPFDTAVPRLLLLAALGVLALAAWGVRRWLRQRRNAALFEQLQAGHPASEVLAQRFANAMHLLRSGIASSEAARPRWWQRQRHVYQLPWYMFIGAPGAGKTTALLHSGLRFPLAERLGTAPVAGIGGTRQCDWWFTDQAVFIDTAGRYTTQDSHAVTDAREWQTFLRLLRRYRPVQPINGVIVTVSVPDLLQGGSELGAQAAAVDRRLQELRAELGLSFPVYLLVTKADLLAGFVEFFGDFDATQREQLWGIGLELPSAADGPAMPADLGARLATLPQRIAALTAPRLQAEPLLQRRAAIYHFVAQVEALIPTLENFARQAFRSAAVAPRQLVRGIHLSSGTQEGNPIDRVLGELSRSFGIALRPQVRAAEGGKAYFLAGLLKRFVIAEAPLAGNNLARQRLRRRLLATGGTTVGVAMLAACVAWTFSYRRNVDYVDSVRERVDKVAREVATAGSSRVDQLLPLYGLLSELGTSDTVDPKAAPWGSDFGLFQGPRLARSADQTYHRVLDATLAPQLAERLNLALRQEADPVARYEALRIALMLAQPARLQRAEVRRWATQAFAAPAPAGGAAPGAGEQQEWLRHLDALLERNALQQVLEIDEAAVRGARSALAALPIEQRAHDRLLRRARETFPGTHTLADLAGPAAVLAFAAQDVPSVAAVFTRKAWSESIEPALEATLAALAAEADWVLDDRSASTQRLGRERAAREPIARQVALRHAQAVRAAWDKLFGALALAAPADGDALGRLASQLAAADSPMRLLLKRTAAEFVAPRAADQAGGSAAAAAYDGALAEAYAALRDYASGPGATAPDRLLAPLPGALNDPARLAGLGRELRAESTAAPVPWREIWSTLADAALVQQRRAQERQIGGGLAELAQSCRRLTAERFPFAPDAKRDMPYADFARLFGPQGLFDSFVRTRLAGMVDTQRRPWRFTSEAPGDEKAQAALRSFELADDIRRLFFPGGSTLPQLRLQLTPSTMDGELLMFSADVDGQVFRYENGPRRPKALTWPGPAATQRVVLRILPAGPSGVGAEVHDGPWALLRVLQRGSGATSRLSVDGRTLAVDVATEPPAGARLLDELARFRCPEPW